MVEPDSEYIAHLPDYVDIGVCDCHGYERW